MTIFLTPLKRSKKEPPGIFLKGEKLEFDFNGKTIRGFRWNYPRKQKVLIVHGHASSILNFDSYITGLIDKNYEVLAFDAPAHGISDGETINVVEYTDFIIYIHEHFGPVQSYIGHSFGGLAIALAMERIGHDGDFKLALVAPATESSTAISRFFKLLHIHDKNVKQRFEKLIAEMSGHPSSWYSVKRAMQHIKAEVIWAHDEEDEVTPLRDALKVKEQNHPNVKFVITRGLGHNLIYRDESVVKAIVDFL